MNHPLLRRPDPDALQARFGRRVAARLTEHADSLHPDIGERLRFARERALQAAQVRRAASSGAASGTGAAALRSGRPSGPPWWIKLASFAPLVLLLIGLGVIGELHDRSEIDAAAEVDIALLADDLPPDAYQDAGFLEYLRTAQE